MSLLAKPLFLMAVVALLHTSGCSVRVNNWLEMADAAFASPQDVELSSEEIADYPYAAQYIQVDDQPRALMALNFDDNGKLKWITGGSEVFITQVGRVVSTVDAYGGPRHTSNLENDPLLCWINSLQQQKTTPTTCSDTWHREVEFGDVGLQNNERLEIHSTFSNLGQESVKMLNGEVHQAVKLSEESKYFKNVFWLELETGRVIKSRQWLSKIIGNAQVQEVKPYSGDLKP